MARWGSLKSPRLGGRSIGVLEVCAVGRRRALTGKFRCARVPGGLPGHEGGGHEGGIEFGQ